MSAKNRAAEGIFDASHTIFSENRRISPRQIRRAMTLEIFGISSLILPSRLAAGSGILGILALAAGAVGAGALVCLWDRLSDKYELAGIRPENGKNSEHAGRKKEDSRDCPVKKGLYILAGCGLLDIAACILYFLADLVRGQLLNDHYDIPVLLTLTAAGVFGLQKGLEPRIRIYEVLFWLLAVPLLVILLIASVSVRPVYWIHTSYSAAGFVRNCWECFLCFSPVSLLLLFKPHCSEPERAAKSVKTSLLLVYFFDTAIYLILLGIFQDGLLSQLEYPAITLMAVVKLPGEFFERQDAFMIGIWFFCLFALFHSLLFYGNELFGNLPLKNRKSAENRKGQRRGKNGEDVQVSGQESFVVGNGICAAAVFLAALFFLRNAALAEWWITATLFAVAPALLLVSAVFCGIVSGDAKKERL